MLTQDEMYDCQKIVEKGISFLLIGKWTNCIKEEIVDCDAILITTVYNLEFKKIVRSIRTHADEVIYLKPLFYRENLNNLSVVHTDGLYEKNFSVTKAEEIIEKIKCINNFSKKYYKENLKLRLISYSYTRGGIIAPEKNRRSSLGYVYPFVELYFEGKHSEKLALLEDCIEEGLLESYIVNKIQLCGNCKDSYLFFKETCPKCDSIDILPEDVIHHFSCAHIAPISKFLSQDDEDLSCPKCDKKIRHIGVDYDKPSMVYTCNKCRHHFQEAEMLAECNACNTLNKLDELIEATIYNYEVTTKGELKIKSHEFQLEEKKSGQEEIFNNLLMQEGRRSFISGKRSYLIEISFDNNFIRVLNSEVSFKLWKEIKKIIENYILNRLFYYRKNNVVQLILIDKNDKEAEELFERLIQNLEIILEDNFEEHTELKANITKIES